MYNSSATIPAIRAMELGSIGAEAAEMVISSMPAVALMAHALMVWQLVQMILANVHFAIHLANVVPVLTLPIVRHAATAYFCSTVPAAAQAAV